MGLPKRWMRRISTVLAATLMLLSPLTAPRAEAFPGIATLAASAVGGGATAMGVGALVSALGLGAASVGMPALALAGAAIGGFTAFAVGNDNGADSGKGVGLGLAAAGASAAALSLGGFLFSPWILLPAVAVGAGYLLFKFADRPQRAGAFGDTRFGNGFSDPFFSPFHRSANTSATGAYGDDQSVIDRIRNVFDRNRRDDTFFQGSTVMPDGTLRAQNDLFGRLGQFVSGRTDTGSYGGPTSFYGPGYGNAGYFSPYALPTTDRTGRVTVGAGQGRVGFQASMDPLSARPPAAGAPTSSSLSAAAEARDEAYQALVEATGGKDTAAIAKALDAYRKASAEFEASK